MFNSSRASRVRDSASQIHQPALDSTTLPQAGRALQQDTSATGLQGRTPTSASGPARSFHLRDLPLETQSHIVKTCLEHGIGPGAEAVKHLSATSRDLRSIVDWTLGVNDEVVGPMRRETIHRAGRVSDIVERARTSPGPDGRPDDLLLVTLSTCVDLMSDTARRALLDHGLDPGRSDATRKACVVQLLQHLPAFERADRDRLIQSARALDPVDGSIEGALLSCGELLPREQEVILARLEKQPIDDAHCGEAIRAAATRVGWLTPDVQNRLLVVAGRIGDPQARDGALLALAGHVEQLAPGARATLCRTALALADPRSRQLLVPPLLRKAEVLGATSVQKLVDKVLDRIDDPAEFVSTCALAAVYTHLNETARAALMERARRITAPQQGAPIDQVAAACSIALAGEGSQAAFSDASFTLDVLFAETVRSPAAAGHLVPAALYALASAWPRAKGGAFPALIETALDLSEQVAGRAEILGLLADAARHMSPADQSFLLSAAATTPEPTERAFALSMIAPHIGHFSRSDFQRCMDAVARLPPDLAAGVAALVTPQLEQGLHDPRRKLRRVGESSRFMKTPAQPLPPESSRSTEASASSVSELAQVDALVTQLRSCTPGPYKRELQALFAVSPRLLEALSPPERQELVQAIMDRGASDRTGPLFNLCRHVHLFAPADQEAIEARARALAPREGRLIGALISHPRMSGSALPLPQGEQLLQAVTVACRHLDRMDVDRQRELIAWCVQEGIEPFLLTEALTEVARHASHLKPEAAGWLMYAAFSSEVANLLDDPAVDAFTAQQRQLAVSLMQEDVLKAMLGECERLPAPVRDATLEMALATAGRDSAFRVTMALSHAARRLSPRQQARLLAISQGGGDSGMAGEAAQLALAGLDPRNRLPALLADLFRSDLSREDVVPWLTRHLDALDADLQCRVIDWAIDAPNAGERADCLEHLVGVAGALRPQARTLLMDAAITVPDIGRRADALQTLAPKLSHFSEPDRCKFFESVERLPLPSDKAMILGALPTTSGEAGH